VLQQHQAPGRALADRFAVQRLHAARCKYEHRIEYGNHSEHNAPFDYNPARSAFPQVNALDLHPGAIHLAAVVWA
jgi:hypothetical protein